MKYSVKYQCFITPFESTEIFMDAFEYYPEHLNKLKTFITFPYLNAPGQPPEQRFKTPYNTSEAPVRIWGRSDHPIQNRPEVSTA